MIKTLSHRGVVSFGEYAVAFFLVIAAAVVMTSYIQRSIQARIRDARVYMINSASQACDANCMIATGLAGNTEIAQQYEPYYAQADSKVARNTLNLKGLLATGVGSTGIAFKQSQENSQGMTKSDQLPPINAANDIVLGAQ